MVNVGDRVFFETDPTDLTPQAVAPRWRSGHNGCSTYTYYTFTIEGHADERGTREYNIALGARRAQTVRDYLASRGIQTHRMRTISYGKERPVAVLQRHLVLVAEPPRRDSARAPRPNNGRCQSDRSTRCPQGRRFLLLMEAC